MGYPIRAGSATAPFNAGGGTGHLAPLPSPVLIGDRVLAQVVAVDPTTTVTTPSGWTSFGADNTGGSGNSGQIGKWYYRDATGTESGDNHDWVTSADVDVVVVYVRYLAGTFNSSSAPELAVANNLTSENPPNLDPAGWATEPTTWIGGFSVFGTSVSTATPPSDLYHQIIGVTSGTNPVGTAIAFKNEWDIAALNPGLFASPATTGIGAFTVAVRGKVYDSPYVGVRGFAVSTPTTATTTWTLTIPTSVVAGDELEVCAVSRDHTAGTALPTLTDDDTGGNTWTLQSNSTDRKALVWRKTATSGTAGKTVTLAGAVGSSCGGLIALVRTASGDPMTNLVLEDNASGNETHAGFTPDEDNSMVVVAVFNVANDNVVSDGTWATLGVAEEEIVRAESTGGSDCGLDIYATLQPGTATGTGAFTWAQTNQVTVTISWAVKPSTEPIFDVEAAAEADVATDVVLVTERSLLVEQAAEADVATDVVLVTPHVFTIEQAAEADVATDVVLETDTPGGEPEFLLEQGVEADVAVDIILDPDSATVEEFVGWGSAI